jgi:signal transduction histidine kinase
MNKFFRKLPLQAKLMLIGLIPFCFLVMLTLQIYNEKTEKLKLFDNYKNYMEESANINGLIDAMQEERKFTFDYAITKNGRKELLLQRPKTDAFIQKLVKSGDPSIAGFKGYTRIGELDDMRNKIDSAKTTPDLVMHFYSNTVFRLNTLNTIPPANTPYLQPIYKDLMAQKILSEMITYHGIISSNIYNVLNTKLYMVETLIGTIGAHDVYISYDQELVAKATPEVLEQYKSIQTTTALKPTNEYMEKLFKTFKFDDSLTAAEWWKISDEGINELRQFQSTIWKGLNKKLDQLHQEEENSRLETLVLLLLALACVVISVCYIMLVISRTLHDLRLAAQKIANGETGVQIKVESNDAIGMLARSISEIDKNNKALTQTAIAIGKGDFHIELQPRSEKDQLGNAIVQMQNDLQQYNQKMESLVAQRTEELARSNEDLQQFAHVASHDLKEPLRKITMFSNILNTEQKEVLSEKGKVYLDKISMAAIRMSDMIEGVLAYSTVSFKEPISETVNLNKILEGVVSDLELAIIQKEAQIRFSELPDVNGIPLLLHQLFYNLINNALKFTRENVNPVITITSEITQQKNKAGKNITYFHIKVSDNGMGFNQDYAERIFGIFSRLNAKDKFEGTGLGLALCRKIVYRHKGEIYAEGKEDEGAVFHVLLPVK